MNVKRVFWGFFVAGPKWNNSWFQLHYVPDQIDGTLYAGITIAKVSILYSTEW